MDILIHSKHVRVTPHLRDLALRRLHQALDRHADHIDRVQAWLSDEGIHNGAHERCRLVVHTQHQGNIVVEETCRTQGAAITKAATDCERAVRRHVERRRDRSTRRIRVA
jgi:ribosomal subunit interface protein